MGTIPAPNIAADSMAIAQAPQNALQEYARTAELQQQTKDLAQQQQERALTMEAQRRTLADQDALTKTIAQYDPQKYSLGDIPKLVTQNGGSGQAALKAQQGLIEQKQNYLKMTDEQFAQEQKKSDLMQGVHDEVSQAPAEQKQQLYSQGLMTLARAGVDVSQEPPQYPGDDAFAQHLQPIRLHSAILADAQKDREITAKEQQAKYKEVNGALYDISGAQPKLIQPQGADPSAWHDAVDKIVPPNGDNGPLNSRTKAEIDFALQRGDMKSAQAALTAAGQQLGGIEKMVAEKTNPAIQAAELHLATAKKAAEQAIADGDPRAAAQLLVDGVVSPSQLVSSRKPAFAQQAFSAAAQISPQWNAQKAEADFKVAGSAQNVAFFGSAKSLTDKGGTLDQLKDAAKDIPGHQLPVFNTIDDAIRASTGSGPVAKYAALALGVADDYSKVMGGGQGSDTSRTQALKIISMSQSPEQRAKSLEGIRGAVSSQTTSRIGNNAVLQKMYGGSAQAPQGGGGDFSVVAPNKKTYHFPDQQSLDNFKRAAGIP